MRYAAVTFVCVAVLGLAGCATNKSGSGSGAMGIVNTKCPMAASNPAGSKVTREFKGEKVGFCCAGCAGKWDALSDADKAAALAKAK